MFAAKGESTVMARRIAIAEIDRAVAGRLGSTRVRGNAPLRRHSIGKWRCIWPGL
jgi:hypothetical protein